VDHKASEGK